ncbi:MAG: hypothetical protein KKH88_00225 [Nanoarchaeota archaeon]|nr:hypothetical protein [Nanoarchaeota archaeon]
MEEKTLFKIAILSALAGILIILFLAENIGPTQLTIGNITKDYLDQTIQTAGLITSSKETPGLYIINLRDSTGELPAIIFKDENITITRYLPVKVIAKVIEYENELELQIEQMEITNKTIPAKDISPNPIQLKEQKITFCNIMKIITLNLLLINIILIIIFLLTIKKGKND